MELVEEITPSITEVISKNNNNLRQTYIRKETHTFVKWYEADIYGETWINPTYYRSLYNRLESEYRALIKRRENPLKTRVNIGEHSDDIKSAAKILEAALSAPGIEVLWDAVKDLVTTIQPTIDEVGLESVLYAVFTEVDMAKVVFDILKER